MNNAFDGKYKEMILNLCFGHVRRALAEYARIFANRYWVQKNKPKKVFFTVNANDFSFNNINVIRAISCREEAVFWEEDFDDPIPNIFYTTQEEDLSIYCLLVLKYFERKRDNDFYGINASSLKDIKKEWESLFGDEQTKKLIRGMKYLFVRKLLRKSIYDVDDIKNLDKESSLNDKSRIYVSPKGSELYYMFYRDSVLLELMREAS